MYNLVVLKHVYMCVCVLSFRVSVHSQHSQRSRTFDLLSFESRHAAAELGETPQTQWGHPGLRGYLRTAARWRSDKKCSFWIYINVAAVTTALIRNNPCSIASLLRLYLWCPCRRSSLLPGEQQRCDFVDCVWPERKHAVQIQSSSPNHAGLWTGERGHHHHWIPRWRYAGDYNSVTERVTW